MAEMYPMFALTRIKFGTKDVKLQMNAFWHV